MTHNVGTPTRSLAPVGEDAAPSHGTDDAISLKPLREYRRYIERIRLFSAKLAVWLLVAGCIFVHHAYREDGFFDLALELTGSASLFLAAIGRVWSAGYIAGQKDSRLIQEGPYSIMRHPLYFFSFLGFLGAGLAMESLVLTAALLIIFLLTHLPVIIREEQRLRQLFDQDYLHYVRRVPMLIPKPWLFRCSKSTEIQCRALNRAVFDASLIGLVFVGTQLLEWCHLHGIIPVFFHVY